MQEVWVQIRVRWSCPLPTSCVLNDKKLRNLFHGLSRNNEATNEATVE